MQFFPKLHRLYVQCSPITNNAIVLMFQGTIAAQFNCEGTTLSGVDFELVGHGYRLSLVKKRFVSGKKCTGLLLLNNRPTYFTDKSYSPSEASPLFYAPPLATTKPNYVFTSRAAAWSWDGLEFSSCCSGDN